MTEVGHRGRRPKSRQSATLAAGAIQYRRQMVEDLIVFDR